jgi:hypothetical protein
MLGISGLFCVGTDVEADGSVVSDPIDGREFVGEFTSIEETVGMKEVDGEADGETAGDMLG